MRSEAIYEPQATVSATTGCYCVHPLITLCTQVIGVLVGMKHGRKCEAANLDNQCTQWSVSHVIKCCIVMENTYFPISGYSRCTCTYPTVLFPLHTLYGLSLTCAAVSGQVKTWKAFCAVGLQGSTRVRGVSRDLT